MHRARAVRCRSTRGAETIEFALLFPLVLVAIVSLIEMGLLFNQYEALTNAAREGARLASIPGSPPDAVKDRVAAYAGAAGMDTALVRSGTNIDEPVVDVGGRPVKYVRVAVSYPYSYLLLSPLVGLIGGSPLSSVTLKAAATMRSEVVAGL